QKKDRRFYRRAPELLADREAVEVGKADVEDDGIDVLRLQVSESLMPFDGAINGESGLFEGRSKRAHQIRIIVDEKKLALSHCSSHPISFFRICRDTFFSYSCSRFSLALPC